MATRWPLVAWAALDGAVHRCASLAAAKAAAAVAHGVAQGIRRKHRAHGDTAALERSTTGSEENDSALKLFCLNFLNMLATVSSRCSMK